MFLHQYRLKIRIIDMKDRYDLETQISELHTFADRLNDISYGILELGMTTDDVANAVIGIATLLNIQTEKLFDTYKQVHFLDEYNQTRVV